MSFTSFTFLRISSLACSSAVRSTVSRMMSSKYKSTVSWWICTTCSREGEKKQQHTPTRRYPARATSAAIGDAGTHLSEDLVALPEDALLLLPPPALLRLPHATVPLGQQREGVDAALLLQVDQTLG